MGVHLLSSFLLGKFLLDRINPGFGHPRKARQSLHLRRQVVKQDFISPMHNPWTQLKSRYLTLDIGIASFATTFFAGIIHGVLGSLFRFDRKAFEPTSIYLCYILSMLLICGLFILRLQRNGIDWRKTTGILALKKIPLMFTFIVFQAAFVFSIGLEYLNTFIVYQFSPGLVKSSAESVEVVTGQISSSPLQLFYYAVTIVAVVIVAPITEEFIFRGVLMHRWAVKWGITASILLTSTVFALAHGDIYILPRFSLAIISAIAYCNTGLLSVSILLHAMNNLIATLFSFINLSASDSQENVITIHSLIYGIIYTFLPLPVLFYFLKWPDSISKLPYLSRLHNDSERQAETGDTWPIQ
jgi:uncharacterized protein